MRPDYNQALEWLESHVNLEKLVSTEYRVPTLDRITQLCRYLADPHLDYPVIHVTGTNGKGSVVNMISAVLIAHGLRVGTYTSPDLTSVTERIASNLTPISTQEFAENLDILRNLEPLLNNIPSRFELLTALAFKWFSDIAVDVAVVEVGLGGTWDATNVVSSAVSVITNIDLDHTELLGETKPEIAQEKAGIIKQASTCVTGETDPEIVAVFEKVAKTKNAVLARIGRDFDYFQDRLAVGGHLFSASIFGRQYSDLYIPLRGSHQVRNAVLALAGCDSFFMSPSEIGEGGAVGREEVAPERLDLVRGALEEVTIPGRLEVLGTRPLVIVDGAHNPAGIRVAMDALDEEFDRHLDRIVVMGLLKGRSIEDMVRPVVRDGLELLVACRAPSPRTVDPKEIEQIAGKLGAQCICVPSLEESIQLALGKAGEDHLVFITGSMYVVGLARSLLRQENPATLTAKREKSL